jgi:hypothetical protein
VEGIDLSKLLQGKPLIIASQLVSNKYTISLSSLADTKANGLIFIN